MWSLFIRSIPTGLCLQQGQNEKRLSRTKNLNKSMKACQPTNDNCCSFLSTRINFYLLFHILLCHALLTTELGNRLRTVSKSSPIARKSVSLSKSIQTTTSPTQFGGNYCRFFVTQHTFQLLLQSIQTFGITSDQFRSFEIVPCSPLSIDSR